MQDTGVETVGPSSVSSVSAPSAGVRAVMVQVTSVYMRTPVKLFRPPRFDYLAVPRQLLAKELAVVPYHVLTHSGPAVLYESVRRRGWKEVVKQIMPPLVANATVGVVLYSTYLACLHEFKGKRKTRESDDWWYWLPVSVYDYFRAGAVAGAASSIVASPLDVLCARGYSLKSLNGFTIVEELFAGAWANVVKESAGFGCYFAVFELVRTFGFAVAKWTCPEHGKSVRVVQLSSVLIAGASAAATLVAVQYPVSKVQRIHVEIPNDITYMKTIERLISRKTNSGLTWHGYLYKGCVRNILTSIPATSVGLLVFEITRHRLSEEIN